jgi:hypothetical protein
MRQDDIGKAIAVKLDLAKDTIILGRLVGVARDSNHKKIGIFCTPAGSYTATKSKFIVSMSPSMTIALRKLEENSSMCLYGFNPTEASVLIEKAIGTKVSVEELEKGKEEARKNAWRLMGRIGGGVLFA